MDELKNHPTALLPDDLLFPPCGSGFRSKCPLKKGLLVHLGCGNLVHPDWINVDVDAYSKADVKQEAFSFLSDLKEGSADWIFMDNFIEHLPQARIVEFMREIHRTLKIGGVVEIIVPHFPTPAAVIEPTHLSYYIPATFQRFTKEYWDWWKQSNGYGYYFKMIHCMLINPHEIYVRMEKT